MPSFLTLCLVFLSAIGCVWGESVTYKVASQNSVSILSGNAPSGSSTSFITTYTNNIGQLTSGNHMTLTLSGYAGCKITGITMSMKSNTSKGAGSFTMTVGSKTLAFIPNSKFNTTNWHGSWTTSYVAVTPAMSISDYVIQSGESVAITISASENSLYCESFTINYAPAITATYTVNLHSGTAGTQLTETSGGAGVTLPQLTSYNSNYTFAGWSATRLTEETSTAP
ncbi:MAG: hypothetical protein MJZ57_10050, partial [Bacteroidales bacterium]|nr:hypothetical protein [Bacteroidales bacterium]